MSKRSIYIIFGVALLALVGLLSIQYAFYQNTVELKEKEFRITASRVVADIAQDLERREAVERMSRNRDGRRALDRLDSIQRVMSSGWNRTDGFFFKDTVILSEDGQVELTYSDYHDYGNDHEAFSSARLRAETRDPFDEAWLEDLLSGFMDLSRFRPVEERVNQEMLSASVEQVLSRYGIDTDVSYALFDGYGRPQVYANDSEPLSLLEEEAYSANVFADPMTMTAARLLLSFPRERAYVMKGVWPLMLTSGLLVMAILAAFAFTVYVILRQKKLSRVKSDFINNMTHELKTPVSTIALACEALRDPDMQDSLESRRRFIGMIGEENDRLGHLIENVLRSAQAEDGGLKVVPVEVDMHSLIDDSLAHLRLQLENKGGHILLEKTERTVKVSADPVHIQNALDNLLDNAIKYSRKEPKILVRTEVDEQKLIISVRDSGIGIAKNQLHKIFDTLYRVPTGNTHDVKGFGLGLSYVKAVVEAHGGHVSVDSRPGQGSEFRIHLPRINDDGTTDTAGRGRPESGQIAA